MIRDTSALLRSSRVSNFEVICAGEARWDLAARGVLGSAAEALRFRPGGAAVRVALALAARGVRVGLSASLGDDTAGRALLARVTAAGVDTAGVSLSPAQTGLLLVQGQGAAARVLTHRQGEAPIAVPPGWAAPVLLLTGVTPVVAHAAAFCKEARAARRAGTLTVIDLNARRHLWAGQDARVIRSLVAEADVVRCSAEDLAVLGLSAPAIRAMMRPGTVLVASGAAAIQATGPFGEIVRERPLDAAIRAPGAGDAFTAAMCAELARAGAPGTERLDVWSRLLSPGARPPSVERSLRL